MSGVGSRVYLGSRFSGFRFRVFGGGSRVLCLLFSVEGFRFPLCSLFLPLHAPLPHIPPQLPPFQPCLPPRWLGRTGAEVAVAAAASILAAAPLSLAAAAAAAASAPTSIMQCVLPFLPLSTLDQRLNPNPQLATCKPRLKSPPRIPPEANPRTVPAQAHRKPRPSLQGTLAPY